MTNHHSELPTDEKRSVINKWYSHFTNTVKQWFTRNNQNDVICLQQHHFDEMAEHIQFLPPLSQAMVTNMLEKTSNDINWFANNYRDANSTYLSGHIRKITYTFVFYYELITKQDPLFWQEIERVLQLLYVPFLKKKYIVQVYPDYDLNQPSYYAIAGILSLHSTYQIDTSFKEIKGNPFIVLSNCISIYDEDNRYHTEIEFMYNINTKKIGISIIHIQMGIKHGNDIVCYFDRNSHTFKNENGERLEFLIDKDNNPNHVLLKAKSGFIKHVLPILKNLESVNAYASLFNGVYTFNNVNELASWLTQLLDRYSVMIGDVQTAFSYSDSNTPKLFQAYFPMNDDAYPLTIKLENSNPQSIHYCLFLMIYNRLRILTPDYVCGTYHKVNMVSDSMQNFNLQDKQLTNCLCQCTFFDKTLGVERTVCIYYSFNYHAILMYSMHDNFNPKIISIEYLHKVFNEFNQLQGDIFH